MRASYNLSGRAGPRGPMGLLRGREWPPLPPGPAARMRGAYAESVGWEEGAVRLRAGRLHPLRMVLPDALPLAEAAACRSGGACKQHSDLDCSRRKPLLPLLLALP
eukprot:6197245-Pleurochrysis_carterae.AAC.2